MKKIKQKSVWMYSLIFLMFVEGVFAVDTSITTTLITVDDIIAKALNTTQLNASVIDTEQINMVYHPMAYATSGNGSKENPYVGWQTGAQRKLNQSGVILDFDKQYFNCTTAIVQGDYRYCLKLHNDSEIRNAKFVSDFPTTNISAYIVNVGISGADADLTFRNTINNVECYGASNGSDDWGRDTGTGQCVVTYRSREYKITNIYGEGHGRYAVVLFQGSNSIIDNVIAKNSILRADYNRGDGVWITGASPRSRNNEIGKVTCVNVGNCVELEDYPQSTSVGQIIGENLTGACLSMIDAQHVTVGQINCENSLRGISVSQNSQDIQIGTFKFNHTKPVAGIQYEAVKVNNNYIDLKMDIISAHISNVDNAFLLINATNFTVHSVQFENVRSDEQVNFSGQRDADQRIIGSDGTPIRGNTTATKLTCTNCITATELASDYILSSNTSIVEQGDSANFSGVTTQVINVTPINAQKGIKVTQNYAASGIEIDYGAVNEYALLIDSDSTGYQTVKINGKYPIILTSDIAGGYGLRITRDIAETAFTSALVQIVEDNVGSTVPIFSIQQDGNGTIFHAFGSGSGAFANAGNRDVFNVSSINATRATFTANVTINKGSYHCLNENCSHHIYLNASDDIIIE